MTLKKLASALAKREGKKSQARIGDIRELLGHLSDIVAENGIDIYLSLRKNGTRRAKRKKK